MIGRRKIAPGLLYLAVMLCCEVVLSSCTKSDDFASRGKVAAIVEQIAGGEQPENIPYETLADYARFVNLQAAERIGIEVSDDILAAYNVLVEADGTSHFGE